MKNDALIGSALARALHLETRAPQARVKSASLCLTFGYWNYRIKALAFAELCTVQEDVELDSCELQSGICMPRRCLFGDPKVVGRCGH